MNPVKSRNVVFSLKRNKQVHPPLFFNYNMVKDVESHTHLGLILQSSMSWRNHLVQVYEKASKRLNMLKFVTYKLDRSTLTSWYIWYILIYIWNNCYDRYDLVNVHIIVLSQEKTLHNFPVELPLSKVLLSICHHWLEFPGPRCSKLCISSNF